MKSHITVGDRHGGCILLKRIIGLQLRFIQVGSRAVKVGQNLGRRRLEIRGMPHV